MRSLGFTIIRVVVQGPGKSDAVLEFAPGLNVVAGASNTGKTYAWQLIDFMCGASRPPKTVALSGGYSYAMIEVRPAAGGVLTLRRALAGGAALAYAVPIDGVTGGTASETLSEQHSAQNPLTISGRLLLLSGLEEKQIRQDAFGKKRSLSFRDVAWLAFVDEERIIAERSPALSEQVIAQTEKKSAFGLFLTGSDDSAIVAQESAKDRKARLALEMSLLTELIDDRETKFRTYAVNMEQLAKQRERIAAEVQEASGLLAAQQSELDDVAATRDRAWSQLQAIKSKRIFVTEQIKRLELLELHYASDKARLESALEAGEFFERLPTGDCPVCGHRAETGADASASDQRLQEFHRACAAEIDKIRALSCDLGATLTAMKGEDQDYEREQGRLMALLARANAAITGLLDRRVSAADAQLSQLLGQQAFLSEAAFAANEVLDLKDRYSVAEQQSKLKPAKGKIAQKLGAAGMTDFCNVVGETLRAWRFPFEGNVSWADREFDLVIGGENRGSMGKGYRAVTHAAFTVALMRYCRAKRLPHPGVVVIDSPLNPFKGADKDGDERVNTEVQEAFYADLAADISGDQVIVFENTEPPQSLKAKMKYTHFSGNPASPRVGFFPGQSPPAPGPLPS